MYSTDGTSNSFKTETDSDSGQSSVALKYIARLTPENGSMSGEVPGLNNLPDKILSHVFGFISHRFFPTLAQVCRRWRRLVNNPALWRTVSLRPDYGGICASRDVIIDVISQRFSSGLRSIELPVEHITVPVLHELAVKCPYLHYLTLDFSKAMQLHDFTDLQTFPSNLIGLTICLSDVIFLEGFMRRLYSCLSSLRILHLIGTFETSNDAEDENYEVINLAKIRSYTPNLTVVNLYGISFLDDAHVSALAQGCIHIQCLSLSFCLKIKGSCLSHVISRCKKLRCLLLEHCGLEDAAMMSAEWQNCSVKELDLTSTELKSETLISVLGRLPPLEYLSVAHCEFFSDQVLHELEELGLLNALTAVDFSNTDKLGESAVTQFLSKHGLQLKGLALSGKPKLAESFWTEIIPKLRKLRIVIAGNGQSWFNRYNTKVHVDQLIVTMAANLPCLERLELQWDPDALRISENSSKFMDQLRLRCPRLRSITLSDGEYFELVKSNFERAQRPMVVRSLTCYTTSIVSLLSFYPQLMFN